ncbi:unnamed protein product [Adineta steineri]|uniref:F-box domain-containing protein n=1 Tax=Adineta steineri TaxID=433720 RepID=A0A814Z7A7_9BILA|nr:unnamed protein product [Adineta steineri]
MIMKKFFVYLLLNFVATYNEQSRPLTCIEELPNELFYEIFEYLDGCDIYKAFSKLNARFHHLINNSPIPLKIQVAFKSESESESELKYYCKNVILPNRNRIVSLYLTRDFFIDEFFQYCIIDASFTSLEFIDLIDISSAKLLVLLSYLKSLPRLFSLSAHVDKQGPLYFNDTYRIILSLPFLKYNKLALQTNAEFNISMPFAINERVSTIEHLTLNHKCTLNELISTLYYTPPLHYLCCNYLIESNDDVINTEKPIVLSNLTYVHFNFCLLEFDELETFIKRYSTNIQVFSTTHCLYTDYLDADRWEPID